MNLEFLFLKKIQYLMKIATETKDGIFKKDGLFKSFTFIFFFFFNFHKYLKNVASSHPFLKLSLHKLNN